MPHSRRLRRQRANTPSIPLLKDILTEIIDKVCDTVGSESFVSGRATQAPCTGVLGHPPPLISTTIAADVSSNPTTTDAPEAQSLDKSSGPPVAVSTNPVPAYRGVIDIAAPGGLLDESILRCSDAIVQCVNCTSVAGEKSSTALAAVLPYGCPYARRERKGASLLCTAASRAKVGTIDIFRPDDITDTSCKPVVINFNAQLKPGRPSTTSDDTTQQRLQWFGACLDALSSTLKAQTPEWSCISFAHGLRGTTPSEWPLYRSALDGFANNHPELRVLLVSDHASAVASAHSALASAAQDGVEAFNYASQSS